MPQDADLAQENARLAAQVQALTAEQVQKCKILPMYVYNACLFVHFQLLVICKGAGCSQQVSMHSLQ